MKNIKFVDINGTEIEGKWNEKFYANKNDENLYRLYIDNVEYNVSKEEKENILKQTGNVVKNLVEEIEKLEEKDKNKLVVELIKEQFYFLEKEEQKKLIEYLVMLYKGQGIIGKHLC